MAELKANQHTNLMACTQFFLFETCFQKKKKKNESMLGSAHVWNNALQRYMMMCALPCWAVLFVCVCHLSSNEEICIKLLPLTSSSLTNQTVTLLMLLTSKSYFHKSRRYKWAKLLHLQCFCVFFKWVAVWLLRAWTWKKKSAPLSKPSSACVYEMWKKNTKQSRKVETYVHRSWKREKMKLLKIYVYDVDWFGPRVAMISPIFWGWCKSIARKRNGRMRFN